MPQFMEAKMSEVDLLLRNHALQGCRGPVHAQFVENWVAYHYFDVTNHRWEMSILELYNKAQGNVTITDMVLGKTNNTISSYQPVPVEVGCKLWSMHLCQSPDYISDCSLPHHSFKLCYVMS